jgi:hypothetical protein
MISYLSIVHLSETIGRAAVHFLIIATAYLLSCGVSAIYQQAVCGSLNIQNIFLSNLIILRNAVITCGALYIDSYPFFDKFVKPTADTAHATGDVSGKRGIEFLSGIVKAALPETMLETAKTGYVYVYWMFFMTLLPFYWLIGIQGICSLVNK